jgi:FkbM family methyltransferase
MVRAKLSAITRDLIVFLNYCLGRGAVGISDLRAEVDVAIGTIDRDEPVVFDVGGNIGKWSEEFRKRIPGGELHIFEPLTACQEAIRKKKIARSEVIFAAVGERTSEMVLYASYATDQTASLHKRSDTFFKDRVYHPQTVRVLSLDDYVAEKRLEFIDFVKFDIEGHEVFALKGFQKCLSSRKVGALCFEFGINNRNSRTTFHDLWDALHKNYSISIITPSGKPDPINEYYEDLEYFRGSTNYLAQLRREN